MLGLWNVSGSKFRFLTPCIRSTWGFGLGLAIARQIIVEKHGGTLTCHSEPGKGTTFIIEIPLQA
ncbi:ATP-binding protein [Lusitaniella coriacea]|uniref:ATP-binding protein n=1 Tax=Lusitaniella coriacea TaxID=1983105 RepID=UPI002D21BEA1|nr:ATP-binding protein [Lusitaniella coriacea]